jgi:hypothetical protein
LLSSKYLQYNWIDAIRLTIQTLMKSNAQLRHEAQGVVPQPPPDLPTATASSSSQVVPPSFDIEAAFAQLMTSMSAL